MQEKHKLLDGVRLAQATGLGAWVVYGVKKANKIFHGQGREPLIFTGRYSTPAKLAAWLDAHPDFVASQVLRKPTAAAAATPAPDKHLPHRRAAA